MGINTKTCKYCGEIVSPPEEVYCINCGKLIDEQQPQKIEYELETKHKQIKLF